MINDNLRYNPIFIKFLTFFPHPRPSFKSAPFLLQDKLLISPRPSSCYCAWKDLWRTILHHCRTRRGKAGIDREAKFWGIAQNFRIFWQVSGSYPLFQKEGVSRQISHVSSLCSGLKRNWSVKTEWICCSELKWHSREEEYFACYLLENLL